MSAQEDLARLGITKAPRDVDGSVGAAAIAQPHIVWCHCGAQIRLELARQRFGHQAAKSVSRCYATDALVGLQQGSKC